MSNENNQFTYSTNQQEYQRKNSEIPTNMLRKQISEQRKVSLSDDDEEDLRYINPNQNKDPLKIATSYSWKIDDNARTATTIIDHHQNSSRQIPEDTSNSIPISTFILIILAVFVSGFKGTSYLLIDLNESEDVSQGGYILRAFWRQLLITLFFIPLIVIEYVQEKKNEEIEEVRLYQKEVILNKSCFLTIILCSFTYAIWVGTLAYSVFHTPMANAYIFNNIYPLFLIIPKFLPKIFKNQNNKSPSNRLEKYGALLAIIVLLLLVIEKPSVMPADLVALVGALAASIYYSNLQKVAYEYPWMLAVFLLSGFTTIIFGVYSFLFESSTFDMDSSHGLFGVFSIKWIFIHILICLLTGVINTKLFSYISSQIKTMYVDIAIMCEAFAALLLAFIFGYQELPNLTECSIFFFYIIAIVMIAIGKSESQIEQISLLDENIQKINPVISGFTIQNINKNAGVLVQNKGSYQPPTQNYNQNQFGSPNNQIEEIRQKKNTICFVQDMSMTDFTKLNQYRNSIFDQNSDHKKGEANNPFQSQQDQQHQYSPNQSSTQNQNITIYPKKNIPIYSSTNSFNNQLSQSQAIGNFDNELPQNLKRIHS